LQKIYFNKASAVAAGMLTRLAGWARQSGQEGQCAVSIDVTAVPIFCSSH
jgi:hypothetical protein